MNQAAEIRKHPSYRNSVRNDIALIKLTKPIKFSDTVRPICLPTQGEALPVGKQCAAAGWGRINGATRETSNVLKQLSAPVQSAATCQRNQYGGWGAGYVEAEMVCAGSLEGNAGVCSVSTASQASSPRHLL